MPRCKRGGCGAWFDSLKEYNEHIKSHRKPRQDVFPEQHKCPNCGRIIPSPFAHFSRCE